MNSPINADGAEIKDAGSTHHHIQSDKDVTVDLAKAPLSHHLREKNTIKWQLIVTLNTALASFPQIKQGNLDIFMSVIRNGCLLWDSVTPYEAPAGILPDAAAGRSCNHVLN